MEGWKYVNSHPSGLLQSTVRGGNRQQFLVYPRIFESFTAWSFYCAADSITVGSIIKPEKVRAPAATNFALRFRIFALYAAV